jgi:hypothetical protein
MKRFVPFVITIAAIMLGSVSLAYGQCAKIQSGSITDVRGNAVTVGYDKYGYNYQAHVFNGLVANYTRPAEVATEGTENLVMKWSDDWLANLDCDLDGKLDRGLDLKAGVVYGFSKGWVTNHFEGDYTGSDGELHHYTYFAKIAYVGPAQTPDPWAATRIWGLYAIIEELQNDQFGEYGGRLKMDKLVAPGLGRF